MDFSKLVMLVGAPRSGTSWIGKIFDSHPDVLYRHEPDLALYDKRLPFFVPEEKAQACVPVAAEYLERLARTPTLKSAGQLPCFRKAYYPAGKQVVHTGMVHALRWAEGLARRNWRSTPVPDLFDLDGHPPLRYAIKTISARGRLRVFLQAAPAAKFVFIMRHPCGQVASTWRGQRQGKFLTGTHFEEMLRTPGARRYGLTQERLERCSDLEKLAWHWALMNEMAVEATEGHSTTRVITYEALCADPIGGARDLFAFCKLDWNPQTERFLQASTAHTGAERYYSVFRNAVASANRWRTELDATQQREVLDVVRGTSLVRYWPEELRAQELERA